MFKDAQLMIVRGKIGRKRIALAVKGGHNGVSHNHNDVGGIIVDIDGQQLLCDLGSASYTRDYFSDKRYTYINCSSLGHSVPIVDGHEQQAGINFAAKNVAFQKEKDRCVQQMDISGAYGLESLISLLRKVSYDKGIITLCDQATFANDGARHCITERLITTVNPQLLSDGSVNIGGYLKLSSALTPKLGVESYRVRCGNTTAETKEVKVYTIDYFQTEIDSEARFSLTICPTDTDNT